MYRTSLSTGTLCAEMLKQGDLISFGTMRQDTDDASNSLFVLL